MTLLIHSTSFFVWAFHFQTERSQLGKYQDSKIERLRTCPAAYLSLLCNIKIMSWERNGPNHALTVTVYQVSNYFSRWRKNYPGQKDKKCPWCVRQGWCRFYSHNVAINSCSLVLPGLSLGFATWWGKFNLLSIMYDGSPTSWSTLEMGPYVIHP